MKAVERIILKIAVVQFLFLLIVQIVIHKLHMFPELMEITHYEGVAGNTVSEILETIGKD